MAAIQVGYNYGDRIFCVHIMTIYGNVQFFLKMSVMSRIFSEKSRFYQKSSLTLDIIKILFGAPIPNLYLF